ncbi:BON domain-containing protein [Actinoplanes sp. TRM88002]|uniref:BON domain-containing protein n=1 Tax=Paractinoplanes hotanensis TaxID=2906497 RepID=A0ABT0XYM9_9ACTN|nr:BON domain-containing protein [Actinoplanes hotanensis]
MDETVAHRVAERILDDPAILSGHLVIDVQNGVVILEGRMDCVEACAAASRQAWATAGVRDVSNRLTTSAAER